MKYFSHYLIVSVLLLLSLMSTQVLAAGAFGNSDYSRAQSQADRGFDDFDKQFEDEDDVKAPVPEHKPAPAPVPAPVVTTPIEKVVATKPSSSAAPSGTQLNSTINRSGYSITLNSCQLDSGSLLCDFSIVSQTKDKTLLIYGNNYRRSSRVFDQQGNEHTVTRTTLSNKSGASHAQSLLVSGIKIKASIAVDNFNNTEDTESLALLELSLSSGKDFKIQYRDVAITR